MPNQPGTRDPQDGKDQYGKNPQVRQGVKNPSPPSVGQTEDKGNVSGADRETLKTLRMKDSQGALSQKERGDMDAIQERVNRADAGKGKDPQAVGYQNPVSH